MKTKEESKSIFCTHDSFEKKIYNLKMLSRILILYFLYVHHRDRYYKRSRYWMDGKHKFLYDILFINDLSACICTVQLVIERTLTWKYKHMNHHLINGQFGPENLILLPSCTANTRTLQHGYTNIRVLFCCISLLY